MQTRFKDALKIFKSDPKFVQSGCIDKLDKIDVLNVFEEFIREKEKIYEISLEEEKLNKKIEEKNNGNKA